MHSCFTMQENKQYLKLFMSKRNKLFNKLYRITIFRISSKLYYFFSFSAIAEVYQEEGDKEFRRKGVCNAIYFYTEAIQVNCKDVQLNAKLYSNRATAYYHLGELLIL